jgi:hypothetical protein
VTDYAVRLEVLAAMSMMVQFLCDIKPCQLTKAKNFLDYPENDPASPF